MQIEAEPPAQFHELSNRHCIHSERIRRLPVFAYSWRSDERFEGGGTTVVFMVVEQFKQGRVRDIYKHVREHGRGLPEGLVYVDSWIEASFGRCFQLMECDDASLLQEWVLHWEDFGTFEIIPVVHSKETAAVVERASRSHSGADN